uniref:RING-type E3 ubiquitin transferase n=1 Tax=Saccoglossus kowalevskii TaxID=10224 RepID=A0ABM0MDJ5_SACKO|nr:PREDICTED: E3 ubiquitin-protein ligase RNF185-like [Saccoglossus kowalevskii]
MSSAEPQRTETEAAGAEGGATGSSSTNTTDETNNHEMYECNICLDTARDAVVSLCGHLFCKLSIMGRNGNGSSASNSAVYFYREKLPPRPAGQRPEPETHGPFQGFGFGDGGFQMSFGIGAFPFGIFASTFNLNDGRPRPANAGTQEHEEEQFLSRVFLWVALLFMFWLLVA